MCKRIQAAVASSMNHCVLTRERLAVLRILNRFYKRSSKKFLDEDFTLRIILNYELVPPFCMKVCIFCMFLTRVFQLAIL